LDHLVREVLEEQDCHLEDWKEQDWPVLNWLVLGSLVTLQLETNLIILTR
jgi:hypothetical protein